jgi:hypothetical protein
MLVDCDSCVVRGAACGGCLVSVVLGAPPAGVELDDAEQRALSVLADAGMVPRLRLVTDDETSDEPIPGLGGDPGADRRGRSGSTRRHGRRIA